MRPDGMMEDDHPKNDQRPYEQQTMSQNGSTPRKKNNDHENEMNQKSYDNNSPQLENGSYRDDGQMKKVKIKKKGKSINNNASYKQFLSTNAVLRQYDSTGIPQPRNH